MKVFFFNVTFISEKKKYWFLEGSQASPFLSGTSEADEDAHTSL
jgi:hypothetical protein